MTETLAPPTPATFTRSANPDEITPEISADGRSVTVRLVRWLSPKAVLDRGRRTPYDESFARGGLVADLDGPLAIVAEREHDGPVVGVLESTEDRDDGLYGTVRLSRSTDGTNMLADLAEKIYRYVSVDFVDAPVPATARAVTRTGARLRRVAFTLNPQHDSPIVAIRSHETPKGPDMETDPAEQTPPPPPAPVTDEPVVTTRSRPTVQGVAASAAINAPRFADFGHFVRAAALGEIPELDLDRYRRALADVVTTDLTGMVRDQWIDEVIDLRRLYAPTVEHWRRRPLPAKGMQFNQPVVTTRPTVGKQTAQKDEITSTAAVIGLESWPIDTYGGGNDISIQALQRAEPDLLNELMRLYTKEMAHEINEAAVTALVAAAAVGVSGNAALEYTTPEAFSDLLIDASAAFMRPAALRRPADIMAISVDLWAALGKARDADDRPLYPSLNPMNAAGTFAANRPDGETVAIPWYVEPDLGTGIKGVIGVSDAFLSSLGPVGTLTADVPAKLGRDVAVYQEAAFGATDASGLVQIVNVTP